MGWHLSCRTCLSEHFWEVIHIGGAERLRLKSLGLKQILGDIGCVDEHPVLAPLLVAKGVKHNLDQKERRRESEGGRSQRTSSYQIHFKREAEHGKPSAQDSHAPLSTVVNQNKGHERHKDRVPEKW